jgi:hypothetical protein
MREGTCRAVLAHDVGAFLRCVCVEKLADAIEGTCGDFALQVLELDKVLFDGVQVRRNISATRAARRRPGG